MGCCNSFCLGRMNFWCSSILTLLLAVFVCVHGQKPNSDGFISIDCGLPSNTSYIDVGFTGLTYVSDDQYIDTGINAKISSEYPVHSDSLKVVETLRSFPNGTKNCYTLTPVTKGSKYLVRATFTYGNYDNLGNFPKFDLYFGVNFWATVEISVPNMWYTNEIIAIAPTNYVQVCLVNTGQGTPFISALDLRPLTSSFYGFANSTQSSNLIKRFDMGSINNWTRFPSDSHDRLWLNHTNTTWTTISTNSSIDSNPSTFDVPSVVLQTAALSTTSSMDIVWIPAKESTLLYFLVYFAETQIVQNTSLREFDIYLNGVLFFDNIKPEYLQTFGYVFAATGDTEYTVSLKSTPRSTLPPIINAIEVYEILPVTVFPTDNEDVSTINLIKASYNIRKGWSGDPCVPANISWTGINCTTNLSNIPRISALNLSSSGLTGAMVSTFGFLTELKTLDLSHNNLSGDIPNSLDQLTLLTFLDLSGNSGLSKTLPPGLQKKQNDGDLTVIFNSSTFGPESPDRKKSSKAVIFVIVAVILLLIVGAVALFLYLKKNRTHFKPAKDGSSEIDRQKDLGDYDAGGKGLHFGKRQFSYAELKLITNDFSEKVGVGGFGEVFKGQVENGKQVAAKVRHEFSSHGTKQFLNEVDILSMVHHKNLVSLIGYCKDGDYIALIYEYMPEGNLQDWLRGRSGNVQSLSWRQRLRIAYESAQGLEYLHKMCNPPLIHRDVKTSNILLSRNLEAKVSDFGLVRASPGTHVSTNIAGTPGYLDPDYAFTCQLTEKSDVYSFGVVLLEIVTGKPPIGEGLQSGQHLIEFVKQKLSKGDIESILDPNMESQYNINSIWKVVELACRCTEQRDRRPDMTAVVSELEENLNLELIG